MVTTDRERERGRETQPLSDIGQPNHIRLDGNRQSVSVFAARPIPNLVCVEFSPERCSSQTATSEWSGPRPATGQSSVNVRARWTVASSLGSNRGQLGSFADQN